MTNIRVYKKQEYLQEDKLKFVKREVSSGGGSGKDDFLKLKDGDKINVVFRGEIYEFYQIWVFGGEKQIFDHRVKGSSARFKANVVLTPIQGQPVVKIWEFGTMVYNQLADINEVYPLEKTVVRISRTGSTKDNTSYGVLPILSESVSLSILEKVKLHVLNNKPKQEAPPMPSHDDMPDFSDEPPMDEYF